MSTNQNLFAYERQINHQEVKITFPWHTRSIIVTNDGPADLLWKLYHAEAKMATMKSGETFSLPIKTNTMFIRSTSSTCNVRLWAFG